MKSKTKTSSERNIPDTRKLVHRHISDRNDVITEEDIRGIQISKELPPFLSITVGAEAMSQRRETEAISSSEPTTSWDITEA